MAKTDPVFPPSETHRGRNFPGRGNGCQPGDQAVRRKVWRPERCMPLVVAVLAGWGVVVYMMFVELAGG